MSDILVTSFTSYGTPLIRYRIGDSVRNKSVYKCECGVESEVVEEILGRTSNYIINTYGQKITEARVANLFKEFGPEVLKGKIIQYSRKDFRLLLVTSNQTNHKDIKLKTLYLIGEDANLKIEFVDDIEVNDNGKYMILERKHDGN